MSSVGNEGAATELLAGIHRQDTHNYCVLKSRYSWSKGPSCFPALDVLCAVAIRAFSAGRAAKCQGQRRSLKESLSTHPQ